MESAYQAVIFGSRNVDAGWILLAKADSVLEPHVSVG